LIVALAYREAKKYGEKGDDINNKAVEI